MNSVAFLQQQIDSITLQISQLMNSRAKLMGDLLLEQISQREIEVLRKYNLKSPDVPV